ncbi:LuxR family transcriptional regulator [Cryptosporangium minutisporangium]|uniref:LuxR family transcriptional regulator n=1 Tax=Cryptosporangium minutisporangium TaxID=113569 RepID=UPI0031E565C0
MGRGREQRQLRDLLDRTAAGRLTLAVIEGPRGSGKSRLLQEFVTTARRRGAATVREADWIDGSGMWRIVAADGPADASPGAIVPRLLTCEHPQWIHPRVWPELEAIARTVPVLVVLVRRSGATWPEPEQVTQAGLHRVVLEPLTPSAVATLLTALAGGAPDAELRALSAVAAGNPQAVQDLVTGLREERLLRVDAGRAGVVAIRLPARIRAQLDATLAALSPPARHLVQVAATIGQRFGLRELAGLLHRNAAALVPAVDEALASGLVIGVDEDLVFRHELVRATVEESLPRSVRVALRDERASRRPRPAPGGPARASGPDRPAPDWRGLTEQERQIAVLVGCALTNQQIARRIGRSPHTVNYHLRQIFRKLDLTSRVELARLARDHTGPDDGPVTA